MEVQSKVKMHTQETKWGVWVVRGWGGVCWGGVDGEGVVGWGGVGGREGCV